MFFRSSSDNVRVLRAGLLSAGMCGVGLLAWPGGSGRAFAELPRWMQDAVGASAIENALYRAMQLPGLSALYPRPPKEAQAELSGLIGKAGQQADLYSLRAMEDEQALDFTAAEADWKAYATRASDAAGAKLELADYYHRRLQTTDEVRMLMEVGSSGAQPGERYTAASQQRSWRAMERLLALAEDQRLGDDVVARAYAAWRSRYPQEATLYARELRWRLDSTTDAQRFDACEALIAQYRKAFPQDSVFPVKAAAEVAYRRGSVDNALAIYDAGFEDAKLAPLWPPELVQSYYSLLAQTHTERRMVADARARLAKSPDDLKAMARLFYDRQQQGNLVAAEQVVEAYRLSKESRKAMWSAQELYTLAQLTEAIHAYPEAARYNYALYHAQGALGSGAAPQAVALAAIVRILLTAPDQPVELGAGNLTMYRDIATLDHGPGYWNGILSLWLNSESPEQAYQEEERRAQSYFHRAKAAQLLALLDKTYPQAAERAELHKELIRTLADYGESALVLKDGDAYLSSFTGPADEADRVFVAMLMADAYARTQNTKAEFALYDRMLAELSAKTAGMPLTAAHASGQPVPVEGAATQTALGQSASDPNAETAQEAQSGDQGAVASRPAAKIAAFTVTPGPPNGVFIAGSEEYAQLLERYLGRLTATAQLPQALAVLRKELDRNPNDPLLYERLASFLEQNNLSAQQEAVFAQAIEKFQDKSWYDKLARLYLREKKREAFAELTKRVTGIFSGTDLEAYFQQVNRGGPQLFLELNLYAHQRFPHDQVFVQNLLEAYQAKATRDQAAWEKLLREHWSDSERLRAEFFDFLNRNGKLDAELEGLHGLAPGAKEQQANPAATRELAEAEMWRSHFEESAPLLSSLADAYPADETIGTEASSVLRSLAYYDASQTARAVAVEKHLLAANPADMDRLARIGDIYADSGAASTPGHENIHAAKPYWLKMPSIHPGSTSGYLQAATIFWDYFQFDDALAEIRAARTEFHQPHLFGYEAGAIFEGKRDLAGAIHEYTGVATESEAHANPEAATRLLQLARRKATAMLVDQATARAFETENTIAALELRERVLKVQKRAGEISPLLQAALGKAATFDEAQAIGVRAQANGLPKVYELAVEREVALVNDPTQKIELSYELVRSMEARNAIDDAARIVDQVYRENPRLLGVVRNTTDFYARNKQAAKAIATLLEAAKAAEAAQPELSRQFVAEAADKSNDSGSYAQARSLMEPLIATTPAPNTFSDPYNAAYLAIVAASYARQGDDAGLKQFYTARLEAIRNPAATMSKEERKQTTVLLRRGLIPALTRLKDYSGALDQYIAMLSAYPEDPSATEEAALYALRYGQKAKLVNFVSATVKSSPKDARFAILLAQVQTTYEDYPAAIEAYAHAIGIRKDRADVYQAKADLEERLQRLDDAVQEYERLYALSYQNPDWMVKVAAARARQGRNDEAVKALEQAWIKGHAATATDYFRVARQLESWQMLEESRREAELGVKAEGDDLLAGSLPGAPSGDDPEGASFYLHLMTRLRRHDAALATLDAARKAADSSSFAPGIVAAQVEKQGIAAVTDIEWRKRLIETRQAAADQRFQGAVLEMGKTVGLYFAPEEKQQFAKLVDARWNSARQATGTPRKTWMDNWVNVANDAGLSDEEARLRRQELLDRSSARELAGATDAQFNPYEQLQSGRMEYAELAQTMDAYAQLLPTHSRQNAQAAEAQAWRKEGDEAAELRALDKLGYARDNSVGLRERHLELLLKRDKPGFVSYAAGSSDEATAMTAPNYGTAYSDFSVTRAALSTHTSKFGSLWEKAYTALLGLYFRDASPATESAFHAMLADQKTIGERIAVQGKESDQVTGKIWFYYGMRYGVYRTLAAEKEWVQRDPEDFLAAGLEHNASAGNFIALARAYADAGKPEAALEEYRHALELAPDSAAVHDAMAVLLWQAEKRDAALAQWREALAALNRIQDKGPAPESFWTGFTLIAQHLGARKLTAQLHGDLDSVLRNYIARNGGYRSDELLHAVFTASASQSEGLAWLLALSTAASEPSEILSDIRNVPWIPEEAREPIYLRRIELARIAASHAERPDDYTIQQLADLEQALVLYYVAQKLDAKAEALLATLPEERQKTSAMLQAQIELAARAHTLEALLAKYREHAEDELGAHGTQTLRSAAGALAAQGDHASALALWECAFELGRISHTLMASDYLGLAEARIRMGNVAGAVELLHRVTLLPGDVYDNYNLAAALLEKQGEDAEAIAFFSAMAKGVPWNGTYSLRLAQAEVRSRKNAPAGTLASLAADPQQSYDLRIQAAIALQLSRTNAAKGAGKPAKLGSAELDLLAGGLARESTGAQQAEQPYFTAARMTAAAGTQDGSVRRALLRQAIAISPNGLSAPGFTGDVLRLAIFRAEAATGHDATALEAIQPLLNGSYAPSFVPGQSQGTDGDNAAHAGEAEDGSGSNEGEDDTTGDSAPDDPNDASLASLEHRAPLPGTHTEAEKLALAKQIAEVYEQTNSPGSAVPYLQLAALLEKDATAQAQLTRHVEEIRTALALATQNAQRSPNIRRDLDQSNLVRPMLTVADMARKEAGQ